MQELLRTPTAMLGPNSTAVVNLSCCCLAWHLIDLSWFQTPTMPGSSPNLRSPAAHRQIGPEIQRVLLARNLVYSPSHLVRI